LVVKVEKGILKMLKKITLNSYLNISGGLILLICSIIEFFEVFEGSFIQLHHGIAIFGIINIMKVVPEVMHGLRDIEKGKEESKKKI
jgi:hypothetical protein